MTLIAIHLLQNHAPSNLNRDDNGDPKDAFFGGTRRARISSQALKRSIRTDKEFQKVFADPALLGFRTKLLPELVREALKQHNISPEEHAAILAHAERFGKGDARPVAGARDTADEPVGSDSEPKAKGKKGKDKAAKSDGADGAEKLTTAQLMFLTQREVTALTALMVTVCEELGVSVFAALETEGGLVNKYLKNKLEPHAVDIGMFGRMTTSSPFKDVEAAVQVAHALSTHKVEQEFDYFTAVDDISGETGAGMIGDVAFNSATYYKYINIDWEELVKNLGGQRDVAITAVDALLRAAMTAIPSGKQNTFAAHNLPDFALVEVLAKNTPVSYANAFLKPVRARDELSLMDASIQAFATYAAPLPARFSLPVQRAVFYTQTEPTLGEVCATIDELSKWVVARLPEAQA